jgi:hypothetical protein
MWVATSLDSKSLSRRDVTAQANESLKPTGEAEEGSRCADAVMVIARGLAWR